MGIRDAEYDRSDREQHQAALRAQLLRNNPVVDPPEPTAEQVARDAAVFDTPNTGKGKHRKSKK